MAKLTVQISKSNNINMVDQIDTTTQVMIVGLTITNVIHSIKDTILRYHNHHNNGKVISTTAEMIKTRR